MDAARAVVTTFRDVVAEHGAETVVRVAEAFCSMVSWAVLASAHRAKFGGVYQYDNYTPLQFLLAAGIVHWSFAVLMLVAKRVPLVDEVALERIEVYGSLAAVALIYTGAVAGAACSTQNHDEFGSADSSVCRPRPHASDAHKRKAAYFCSRVAASVVFAFFATIAAVASLWLVFLKRQADGARLPHMAMASSASGAAGSGGYDPIDATAGDDESSNFIAKATAVGPPSKASFQQQRSARGAVAMEGHGGDPSGAGPPQEGALDL